MAVHWKKRDKQKRALFGSIPLYSDFFFEGEYFKKISGRRGMRENGSAVKFADTDIVIPVKSKGER